MNGRIRRFVRCLLPVAGMITFLPVETAANTVQVTRYRFDPIAEGQPLLPVNLTARAATGPALRLIQLDGKPSDARIGSLKAVGIEPLQYYPHNTYLIWSNMAQMSAAEELEFVRWQGLFHPAYKLSPDLDNRQGRINNVSFFFYNDGNVDATLAEIRRLGGEILLQYPAQPDGVFQTAITRLDAEVLEQAAQIPTVVWIGFRSAALEPEDELTDQIVAANHPDGVPELGYLAHLSTLGVDGTGVSWAVIDSGIDFDHPELGSRIVHGWSGVGGCETPGDDCPSGGHGTHVAGILGGDGSTGVADPDGFLCGLGMAPKVNFVTLSIFKGLNPPLDPLPEYSKQAVIGGATGINNSWSTGEGICHGYQDSERAMDIMSRDGNWDVDGAEPQIIVFSAGNQGPHPCSLTAPKEAKNVIVSGGTHSLRQTDIDLLAVMSSRGPTVDGRFGPTVVAPSSRVYSTRNDARGLCTNITACGSPLHSVCGGTSMAAPHVSGTAVLMTEWWRRFNSGADPSPAMTKALLVNSAVSFDSSDPIPNRNVGWGRVNVTELIGSSLPRLYSDQRTVFDESGEEITLRVAVPDGGRPVKVTLAWSDAPGAVGANPALVNDLNLEVEHDGTAYLGNVFEGGWSVAGGSADTLETLESVYLRNPTTNSMTVRIRASAINGDGVPFSGDITDQDFALVCTNCALLPIFSDGFESGDTDHWSTAMP
ncbi:MAG: S8 family serine peptidase [Thermoanaerobaculia bacterium]|nr:S8 family serine peptidase [Thermoanaerobaculia bacterium]